MATKISEWFQSGTFQKCVSLYESIDQPLSLQEEYLVGISYLFLEKYGEAKGILIKIKRDNKILPDFNVYLSFVFFRTGDYKRAKYYLDKEKENQTLLFYELNIELSLKMGLIRRLGRLLKEADAHGLNSVNISINLAIYYQLKRKEIVSKKILMELFMNDSGNEEIVDNLIKLLSFNKQSDQVVEILNRALKKNPKSLKYLWRLATEYSFQGLHQELEKVMIKVKAIDPEFIAFREILTIPSVYESEKQITDYRKGIEENLNDIEAHGIRLVQPQKMLAATPFFLSYHDESNKNILSRFAAVLSKGLLNVPALKSRSKKKKRKIGLISQHFFKHSVMDFYENTLANFPKDFHITMININPAVIDKTTQLLKDRADDYYQLSTKHEEIIPLVLKCEFDMIIYPEVGMSPCIYYLALQRLAPIQVAIIGHPDTSGMKSIDYYISWKYFHSCDPKKEFTESVIQLKNLPLCYNMPEVSVNKTPIDMGLPPDAKLFFIPMMIFKLHPKFDAVIEGIIANHPKNYVLIIRYNNMEKVVIDRLKKRLDKTRVNQLVVSGRLKRDDYYTLLGQANVILETFPFGGGNTMLQSLAVGTPYVSLKSKHLRGSFGSGFYRYIGETRFIADTIDEYIKIAIETANNPNIKADFKKIIQKNKAKLFNNMDGPHEFYDWMRDILNR